MKSIKAVALAVVLAAGAIGVAGTASRAEAADTKRPVREYTLRIDTYNYDTKGHLESHRTRTSGRYTLLYDAERDAKATSHTYTTFGRKTVIRATVIYAK